MTSLPDMNNWKKADENDISEITNCYCPNCESSDAVTLMLPTSIPMFREIYIMSLTCENCNFKSSEVSFGGEIQPKGERISFIVTRFEDLNRQIIKSDSCTICIPVLDLEIPPRTQRGVISTIEGFLMSAAQNLEALQPERLRLGDVENFHRCRTVILGLKKLAGHPEEEQDDHDDDVANDGEKKEGGSGEGVYIALEPFEIIIDDPAGNSFIENPFAPTEDPNISKKAYNRTPMQDLALGLQPSQEAMEAGYIDDSNPAHKNIANTIPEGKHMIEVHSAKKDDVNNMDETNSRESGETGTVGNLGKQEALMFPTTCASCRKQAETTMCVTDIPHFKEVVIMSLLCEHCGYKSNEIKGGGAIPKFGTRIILYVRVLDDLQREVLKSDTAGLTIPELELELQEGSLDGLYTTVEGLLDKLYSRLESANPFHVGDAAVKQHSENDGGEFSVPSISAQRYIEFLSKLKSMKEGYVFPFTLVIDDPLSNSFVGPVPADALALALQAEKDGNNSCYKDYVDQGMLVEEYERSFEQCEVLGLNDMKTENYQMDSINEDDTEMKYYGTDQPEELPDRLRRLDFRGPDHPHEVAKAPVEGDTIVMGAGSNSFATPALAQRGKIVTGPVEPVRSAITAGYIVDPTLDLIARTENNDRNFIMCEVFDGPRNGMIFKLGKQGMGYYTDVPIETILADK